jgi:hypothetical protein
LARLKAREHILEGEGKDSKRKAKSNQSGKVHSICVCWEISRYILDSMVMLRRTLLDQIRRYTSGRSKKKTTTAKIYVCKTRGKIKIRRNIEGNSMCRTSHSLSLPPSHPPSLCVCVCVCLCVPVCVCVCLGGWV